MRLKNIIDALHKGVKNSTKKAADFTTSKVFKKVGFDEAEHLTGAIMGIEFTSGAKKAITAGALGYGTIATISDISHKESAGTISAGQLANTINESVSPGIVKIDDMIQQSPEYADTYASKNLSKTQDGINPEIVFAMHELRNGGR